jgi:hypothetical protein|nr:choice-of-anchor D domain-containing protein [Kofleriaceae bacterium]
MKGLVALALAAMVASTACSSPSTLDEPTSEITQGLTVANGSFETGDYTGWTAEHVPANATAGTWGIVQDGQTISPNQQVFDFGGGGNVQEESPGLPTTYHATDGAELAILLVNGPEDHRLFQTVAVPQCQAVVRWDMAYNNHEATNNPSAPFDPSGQFLAVNVRDPSTDNILTTPYKTTTGVDAPIVSTMTGYLADISSFAGQTIRLDYEAEITEFFFDIALDNIRVVCKGLSPDKATLAFGGVPVHSSATIDTTITNQSNAPITLTQLQLGGGPFALVPPTTTLPVTIPAGGSVPVRVKFTPGSVTTFTSSLTLVSNDPNGNTVVPITGTGLGAALSVSPSSLAFPTTQVGDTTATQPVTIQNIGGASLVVDSVSIPGPYTVQLATPVTITAGNSVTAQVAFAPTAAGDAPATLTVHATDGEAATVACDGTGQAPSLSVSASELDFGSQRVGTQSATQAVIVTNTGIDNLTLSSLAAAGTFTIVAAPGLPATIAPNGTAEIDVAFAPIAAGATTGSLAITSTAASSPDTVALTGAGIAPVVSAPAVAFGNQHVGTTGTAPLFVTNNGTDTLHVSALAATAPFSIATTAVAIAPGDTHTFTASFTPGSEAPFGGTITVTSDDPITPSLAVAATGTGVLGHVSIAPGAVSFGAQRTGTTSAPQPVTITNVGTDTLNISSVTLAGGPFAGSLGPTSLVPGAHASLTVTFSPVADGPASTVLSVVSDAPTSPDQIAVTGTGVEPIASANPSSLTFGAQRVGTTSAAQTVTVKNTGSSTLTITAAAATGAFAVQPPALPAVLAIGQTASFAVTFAPTAGGPATGTLAFTSDATASPSVALAGTGTAPGIAAAPLALAFGNQRIHIASAPQTVDVSNTGTASLTISSITPPQGYAVAIPSGGALPLTILPGAHATFAVTFTPVGIGPENGSIVFASDAAASPTTVAVTGTSVDAVAAMSPPSQDFGEIRVGTTGAAQTLSVTNSGDAAFVVSSVTVPPPFVLVSGPTLPATVAGNSSLSLSVAFAPTAVGSAGGAVSVSTDAGFVSATLTGTGVASSITASLNPVDFGSVSIHTTSTLQLQLQNPGSAPLTVSSLLVGGADASDFALSPSPALPATVAPGDALTLDVAFTPTARGTRAAQLVATSDALGSASLAVSLTGRGIGAHVVLEPTELDFGSTTVGSASPPRAVTVANTGDDALVVSAIVLGGANGADFTDSQALPLTIPAGSAADVPFQFAPTAGGERQATATFTTSDPFAPTATLALVGGGQTPSIAASPGTLDFGSVRVGSDASLPITLSNTGSGELTISALALAGVDVTDFVLDAVTLPIELAPGGSATLHVSYEPTVVATEAAELDVTSDDPATGALVVPIKGIGVSPSVDVAPATLDFGGQLVGRTSAPRQVTIHNTGTGKLNVTALGVSGARADLFELAQPPNLPATIPPGSSLVLSLTVAPTVIGADAADLDVETDASDAADATVHLTALGVSTALSVSPSSIDFGTTHVHAATAPVTVTLSNLSGDAIQLVDATLAGASPGDFTVSSLAGTLAAGSSATATVVYDPAAAATSAATIDFGTTDLAIPEALVGVGGRAATTFVVVDHGSLDFGSIEVGGRSGAKTVTIENATTSPVTIASVTSADAQFVVDASAISGPLAPGATATFTVVFAPASEGSASSAAAVTLAGASMPELSVALTGTGASRPSSGGCSTSGSSSPSDGAPIGLVVALLGLSSSRRRSRR